MMAIAITILIIFVTTVIATILQRRAKDPCLKKFHGHVVYVQLKSGRWVWGRLHVYAKSLELEYETPSQDVKGHVELSYLLFEEQLPLIHIVLRASPKKGTKAFLRYELDLRKLISPSMWFNFRRGCRNVWNTLRDAFAQSVGVLVGQLKSRYPTATLATADQKITSTGQMLVTFGNNAYEPILEKYLGKAVVAEMLNKEEWIEQVGVLQEYSDRYILLRDVDLHSSILAPKEMGAPQRVDVAFPRAHSMVRHLSRQKSHEAK
jgi:hypothetical protein